GDVTRIAEVIERGATVHTALVETVPPGRAIRCPRAAAASWGESIVLARAAAVTPVVGDQAKAASGRRGGGKPQGRDAQQEGGQGRRGGGVGRGGGERGFFGGGLVFKGAGGGRAPPPSFLGAAPP